MTIARENALPYRRRIPGPDPAQPFTVLQGVAVVIGLHDSVTLPAGATWPGTWRLSPEVQSQLQPWETRLLGNTVVTPWTPTPREVEFAAALVVAQLLRGRSPLPERQALLRHCLPATGQAEPGHNLDTLGAALAVSRSTLRGLSP
ncbi:hypothetical protein [Deinococcus multiflagellatus]|uniref:Uncharacterized protein n=1 Tax=Deinococcus multiflagellatus TaxID=1656887 RepID=A0ABW1ZTB4_9DEIO|nr:hypothetical protein [Deinococcus multiflagellatus]MBZ9715309.1 hypothetical protein [Deinococcus multiflagellatus]